MRLVLLALPLLLGNQPPPPCPALAPGERLVEATVETVEQPRYHCDVASDADNEHTDCITVVPDNVQTCAPVLTLVDGTKRATDPQTALVQWCGVPAGRHSVVLCAPSGALDCTVTRADSSVLVYMTRSLPAATRVHFRIEGREVVRDTNMELVAGQRTPYVIRPGATGLLQGCDVIPPPAQRGEQRNTHARGCGHCSAGDGGGGYLFYAALVLLGLGRRRR